MAGKGFLFIAHTGILQPCGFLPVECGDLRQTGFDVRAAYESSPVLSDLAHADALRGACGACAFRGSCGGCRARAFALSGDYRDEDPSCVYARGERAS
jgi:radical SAM protein with 4Fe4S-binding SPASM domain